MGAATGQEKANAAAAAATVVLLGPCMICLMPCYYICARPLIKCFSALCSPFGICFTRLLESCGLVNLEDGTLTISNPFAGTNLPGLARGMAQRSRGHRSVIVMAPRLQEHRSVTMMAQRCLAPQSVMVTDPRLPEHLLAS